LGRQAVWVDEGFSIVYSGIFGGLKKANLLANLQGPFHALLLFLWSRLFGTGESALRSIEVLIGTAAVPAFYWALRPSTRPAPRWLAVGLLAISPFHLWYSQEIRGYALLILFAILSMGLFLRLLAGQSRSWVAYTVINTLGLLSNLSFTFLLAAQAVALLAWRQMRARYWRRTFVSWVVTVLLISPWLAQFWVRILRPSGALEMREVPAEEMLRGDTSAPILGIPYTYFALALGYSYGPSLRDYHEIHRVGPAGLLRAHLPAVLWAAVFFGLAAVLGVVRLWREGGAGRVWLCLVIVPVLLTYGVATRNVKVLNPRYASVALPGYLLALAHGVLAPRGRAARLALAGAILVPSGVSIAQNQTCEKYWKEDARAVSTFLAARTTADDGVFLIGTDLPFRFYYWNRPPGRPAADWEDAWHWMDQHWDERFHRFEDFRARHRRTLVLFLRPMDVDPTGRWLAYMDERFPQAGKVDFLGAQIRILAGDSP
jgi:uncharacterized membrane protein